jgi:hypothetical protein
LCHVAETSGGFFLESRSHLVEISSYVVESSSHLSGF